MLHRPKNRGKSIMKSRVSLLLCPPSLADWKSLWTREVTSKKPLEGVSEGTLALWAEPLAAKSPDPSSDRGAEGPWCVWGGPLGGKPSENGNALAASNRISTQ